MFNAQYWNPRYWAARYWPKVGASGTTVPRLFFVMSSSATRQTAFGQIAVAFSVMSSTGTRLAVTGRNDTAFSVPSQRATFSVSGAE